MKLKKRHIFTITACAIAAIFFTCVLAVGMSAEPPGTVSEGPRAYSNQKVLDMGEYTVDSLDISWLTGPVTVGASPDGNIHITERSAKELGESDMMKVSVDSGELKIRWDDQWFRKYFNFNFGWFGQKEKELEVLLPPAVAGELQEAVVGNVSGDLSVTGCTAETLKVSTVSGKLTVNACSAQEAGAESVSGGIALSGVAASGKLTVNTVSGGMELTGISAGELGLDTVSGGCRISGEVSELTVNTVSGDVSASLSAVPGKADMDSVSGGLRLELPAGSGFTAEHDSVSGSFECAFPTEDLGGGRVRCGGGGADIRMNTTSGGMVIARREI